MKCLSTYCRGHRAQALIPGSSALREAEAEAERDVAHRPEGHGDGGAAPARVEPDREQREGHRGERGGADDHSHPARAEHGLEQQVALPGVAVLRDRLRLGGVDARLKLLARAAPGGIKGEPIPCAERFLHLRLGGVAF